MCGIHAVLQDVGLIFLSAMATSIVEVSVVRCLGLNADNGAGLQQVWAVSECSSLRPRKLHICIMIPNLTAVTNALYPTTTHQPSSPPIRDTIIVSQWGPPFQ